MNILLTGGTGYIGSHTAIELLNEGHHVAILDNLANSKITVLDKIEQIAGEKPTFYKVDLLNQKATDAVFASEAENGHKIDLVIHFAGLKAVAESVEQPIKYYENNIMSTLNLLKSMKANDCHRIIFSSSATVYGEQPTPELTEDMPTGQKITNPYGQTKFMIEQILKDLAKADPSLAVTILRYFNPVGNHPSGLIGEDPNGIPNNLMPIIMKVARGEIKELSIYGDDYDTRDGTCIRDYIHVVDLAKGHVAAANHQEPGVVKIYNLGTGQGTSVKEMVTAFEKAAGKPLPHKIAPRRPGDLAEIYANPAKAKQELGWQTALTIEDAMKDTIEFLVRASS